MNYQENSSKSGVVTLLLFLFFCYLGLHRMYVGKIVSGLYIIGLELLGIFLISVKLVIISKYYSNVDYGKSYYFFNIIGLLGYICFILVLLQLVLDLSAIFSGNFLDKKGKKVIL